MASVCPSMVTVPVPPDPIWSSTAAMACCAAGASSALPKANSTSAGSRITVFFVPPASAGPTAGQSTAPTFGSPSLLARSTGSSTRVGDPAGCTGTWTGSIPSISTASSVVSSGGAGNTAVTVIAPPGGTSSPLFSLSRPLRPCAVSISYVVLRGRSTNIMIRSIWSMPSVSGEIGCPVSFANSNCRASSAVPTRTRRTSRARTCSALDRGCAAIPVPGGAAAEEAGPGLTGAALPVPVSGSNTRPAHRPAGRR